MAYIWLCQLLGNKKYELHGLHGYNDDIRNKEPQKLHGLTPDDIENNELHGLRGLMV